ncbi:hypothetical protein ANCCAN_03900 [Ancylostoma caninum]|uniref:Uncharacterized protein n=1 Tax=Ancylostoma caninum TaxID=29170 RepID=A0A368H365_ANCCA|nr:hypothetical protein ANCCAN_03900 [Ancylostoma caninum]
MAKTTPTPLHMPTLIPTVDRAPRLPNNPFSKLDISKPTVVHLPIPPEVDENFER